ncbi:MAG: hypothetical protein WDZ49_15760 [Litorilinea sp.]
MARPWSYLKFPYYKPLVDSVENYAAGMYRVGPLARLNVCDYAGTPRADEELGRFRQLAPNGRVVTNGCYYHYARLIEILFALEKIGETLADPTITDTHVRSRARVNQLHGIGLFDPCLSCSTHAVGQMPLAVQLVGSDGGILDEIAR